jgi:PAS domain S-box-containing protein
VGVAIVVRDLSDLARAEEALERQERGYRLLFLAYPQPMWVYDLETLDFLAVNDCAVQVYGYSREEFLTMSLADIRPSDDLLAVRDAVQRPRSGAHTDGPWRHLRKNGSQLWVEVTACTLEFERRAARLIVALDVTESVLMEGERQDNARRQQKFLHDVLASVTDGKLQLVEQHSHLPFSLVPVGEPVSLTQTDGLSELRRRVREATGLAGHSEMRTYDLAMGACEAGMNAIVHAGGGTAQVAVGETGVIQVRVEDQGQGILMENLPRAALSPGYSTTSTLGYGLKVILQTVDRVFLLTRPTGTTLLLEQDREPLSAAAVVEKSLGLGQQTIVRA